MDPAMALEIAPTEALLRVFEERLCRLEATVTAQDEKIDEALRQCSVTHHQHVALQDIVANNRAAIKDARAATAIGVSMASTPSEATPAPLTPPRAVRMDLPSGSADPSMSSGGGLPPPVNVSFTNAPAFVAFSDQPSPQEAPVALSASGLSTNGAPPSPRTERRGSRRRISSASLLLSPHRKPSGRNSASSPVVSRPQSPALRGRAPSTLSGAGSVPPSPRMMDGPALEFFPRHEFEPRFRALSERVEEAAAAAIHEARAAAQASAEEAVDALHNVRKSNMATQVGAGHVLQEPEWVLLIRDVESRLREQQAVDAEATRAHSDRALEHLRGHIAADNVNMLDRHTRAQERAAGARGALDKALAAKIHELEEANAAAAVAAQAEIDAVLCRVRRLEEAWATLPEVAGGASPPPPTPEEVENDVEAVGRRFDRKAAAAARDRAAAVSWRALGAASRTVVANLPRAVAALVSPGGDGAAEDDALRREEEEREAGLRDARQREAAVSAARMKQQLLQHDRAERLEKALADSPAVHSAVGKLVAAFDASRDAVLATVESKVHELLVESRQYVTKAACIDLVATEVRGNVAAEVKDIRERLADQAKRSISRADVVHAVSLKADVTSIAELQQHVRRSMDGVAAAQQRLEDEVHVKVAEALAGVNDRIRSVSMAKLDRADPAYTALVSLQQRQLQRGAAIAGAATGPNATALAALFATVPPDAGGAAPTAVDSAVTPRKRPQSARAALTTTALNRGVAAPHCASCTTPGHVVPVLSPQAQREAELQATQAAVHEEQMLQAAMASCPQPSARPTSARGRAGEVSLRNAPQGERPTEFLAVASGLVADAKKALVPARPAVSPNVRARRTYLPVA